MKKIVIVLGHPQFYNLLINIGLNLKINGNKVYFINSNYFLNRKYNLDKINSFCNYSKYINNITGFKIFFKKVYKISEKNIKLYLQKKLKKTENLDDIDLFIFWNGLNSYEYDLAKFFQKDIICLENGYFPNTIQIGKGGINASNHVSGKSIKDLKREFIKKEEIIENIKPINLNKIIKVPNYIILYSIIKRLCIFGFNFFYRFLVFYIKDYIAGIYRNIFLKKIKNIEKNKFKKIKVKDNILYAFQVHDDTQIFLNSNCNNSIDIVKNSKHIFEKLNKKNFLIKLHPLDIGRYNYLNTNDLNGINIFNSGDIFDFFSRTGVLVTINSSVGFQSISRGIKTITYGKALYSGSNFVLSLNKKNNNYKNIKNFLEKKNLSIEENENFIKLINKLIFITGNWKKIKSEELNVLIKNIIYLSIK